MIKLEIRLPTLTISQKEFSRRCAGLINQKIIQLSPHKKSMICKIRDTKTSVPEKMHNLHMFLADTIEQNENLTDKYFDKLITDLSKKKITVDKLLNQHNASTKNFDAAINYFSDALYVKPTNQNIIEINKKLRQMGINVLFSLRTSLDFAKLLLDSSILVKERGISLPTRVHFNQLFPCDAITIMSHSHSGSIIFDEKYAAMKKKALFKRAKQEYEIELSSTKNPAHKIFHEFIHSAHAKNNLTDIYKQDLLYEVYAVGVKSVMSNKMKAALNKNVSHYATKCSDGTEAVAEIGAGLLDNKVYPPGIMNLYERLLGPKLKGSTSP